MADIAMTTAVAAPAEPDGAPRLPVLDILRGIAILGILFMNINDMGGSLFGSGEFPRALGWSQADQVAWWLREVLANGTARCMLEMLFGVGMVILTDRAATRMGEWRVLRAYAARNIVLFLFGVVHVFILLWPGDILHTYGLAALVAMLFRRFKPQWLLPIGLLLATVQLTVGTYFIVEAQHLRVEGPRLLHTRDHVRHLTQPERKRLAKFEQRMSARARGKAADHRQVDAENRARTGTPASWVKSAWQVTIDLEKTGFELGAMWEAAGTMLVGAALYKWGVIQGRRPARFYGQLAALAYLVGLSLRAGEAWATTRFDDWPYLVYMTTEYARLATTLGHVALVNLLLTTAAGARALKSFEAAGRTALTVYIAQTLVCLWVLYPPWGFRLYGHQGWAALMTTALAVDAVLLLLANLWVRRFSIAPVEWAWRSIIARQPLPFRRRGLADVGSGVTVAA